MWQPLRPRLAQGVLRRQILYYGFRILQPRTASGDEAQRAEFLWQGNKARDLVRRTPVTVDEGRFFGPEQETTAESAVRPEPASYESLFAAGGSSHL